MTSHIQAIRGMNDILPEQIAHWNYFEKTVRELLAAYGYQELRLPILEKTELFKRSTGEVTDIVEKEMYSFEDRNGDNISLRPEGTPGCVRAGIEHGLLYNQVQRWWYMGPMFRHERPQKGRYRQFHQLGIETFGIASPDIDAELIIMTARLWQKLKLQGQIVLQLNSLGTPAVRLEYRKALVAYFTAHYASLDEDSQRRLQTNPLRILDSKNPALQTLIEGAPKLLDYLDEESELHFKGLCQFLDNAGVAYQINPRLVRGLDYYTKTVFEWVTASLGAQGTVCAGGRYDGLVEHLGGKATPAVGFAMGVERLVALIEQAKGAAISRALDCYLVLLGDDEVRKQGFLLAEKLRTELPQLTLLMHCGSGDFKSQLKRADKSGASYALILGENELAKQEVLVKPLRDANPQTAVAINQLVGFLKNLLS